MRLITIEEHFGDPAVAAAGAAEMNRLSPGFRAAYGPGSGLPHSPSLEDLADLDSGRLAAMDACGIDVQVLSCLSTQLLPAADARELVPAVNDRLAAAIARHPDRFAGFAALPTAAPEAAGDELRRAVGELGLVGTLIHGRTGERFLSEPQFDPVLRAAAELQVPIYLHPAPPPRGTTDTSYVGLDPIVATRLQTAAWGWHVETGLHFLHLVLHGVFDRYPDLQVILGHWGEMIPWFLDRLDDTLPQRATSLERPISDYVRANAYLTPSGMFSQAQLRYCADVLGTDRIIYSVDYPFLPQDDAVAFLEHSDLPEPARHDIAHGNAEQLFKLSPSITNS
ncbi:amidohydrolase family protein [Actinomycetospora flava]|uniref:Amidohydrolase family protein n=1 Tax=Actinomycetospora flava TaxID=3129232 RepID=A0ABU8M499_9PSEU